MAAWLVAAARCTSARAQLMEATAGQFSLGLVLRQMVEPDLFL
jgi:hypothetical protein